MFLVEFLFVLDVCLGIHINVAYLEREEAVQGGGVEALAASLHQLVYQSDDLLTIINSS